MGKLNKFELIEPTLSTSWKVICTENPYYIGEIWRFKDYQEFTSFRATFPRQTAEISPYLILVAFYGSLTGKIQAHPAINREIQLLMEEMAEFYREQKINKKPSNFKSYLL